MTQPEAIPPSSGGVHPLRLYYECNEGRVAAAAFVAGFVFDVLTLARVDSWLAIGQQLLYLAVISTVLLQMFFEDAGPPPIDATPALKRWYYRYHTVIVHFLFGSLLNLYAIYYFKSSSLLASFSFMAVLAFLVLANESKRFKSLGLPFKFALLALCLLSFFAHVTPIFAGSIGLRVFMLSMIVGSLPLIGIAGTIRVRAPGLFPRAGRQILGPWAIVLVGFLVFYMLKLIPPVPLSIPFIGVYHAVERTADGYRLSHERPRWRFWHNGDQEFLARPGDRVYVFFRIFSPVRFSDRVSAHWYWKDPGRGWLPQDSIPIDIVGGREQGFRGYGVKSNYQPGRWKVQVETVDGREIGRIYFHLELAPAAPRNFEIDVQ